MRFFQPHPHSVAAMSVEEWQQLGRADRGRNSAKFHYLVGILYCNVHGHDARRFPIIIRYHHTAVRWDGSLTGECYHRRYPICPLCEVLPPNGQRALAGQPVCVERRPDRWRLIRRLFSRLRNGKNPSRFSWRTDPAGTSGPAPVAEP